MFNVGSRLGSDRLPAFCDPEATLGACRSPRGRASAPRHQDWRASGSAGPSAVRLLTSLPHDEDKPWVIAGRKPGWYLTDLRHPWRRIRARAGLDGVRIHDSRHSFASRALALGEGLPDDRQIAWTHAGPDDGSLCPSCPRHRQGIRRAHRRQHRPRPRCRGIAQHPRPHRSERPLSASPKIQETRCQRRLEIQPKGGAKRVPPGLVG